MDADSLRRTAQLKQPAAVEASRRAGLNSGHLRVIRGPCSILLTPRTETLHQRPCSAEPCPLARNEYNDSEFCGPAFSANRPADATNGVKFTVAAGSAATGEVFATPGL
jgi:hypothetical protein